MPFLDGKPVIITKRNTDKHGNPISVKQIETKQVVDIHNSIPLNYSIDRNHPIIINGMHQIYNKDEISENTFYADYDQGILYFHPRLVGKSITITYMGTGYILISSDRIYRYNKGDGTSATESIEASLEKLENILNTIIKNGGGCDQIVAEVIGSRTDAQGQTFPSLGDRLNYITTQLDNLTTIVRYKRLLKVDTDITTVIVGIAEYNPKSDTLSVYLSGVRMIEGEDYSLDENNRTITCLKGQWNIGDELYFEVLKRSTDATPPGGGGSLPTSIDASNVVLNNPMFGANNAQDAFIQIDILLKDKVDKKDFNDLTNNFNLLNQEVIDARTDKNGVVNNNLKERLYKVDSHLENIDTNLNNYKYIRNGLIQLPTEFPKIPFSIYKANEGYYTDFDIYKLNDWSGAIEVYISNNNVNGDGLSPNSGISLGRFINNVDTNVYGKNKKFILNIIDNIHIETTGMTLTTQDIEILIRSSSSNGFSWIGRFERPNKSGETTTSWVQDSGVYKITQKKNYDVIDIFNTKCDDFKGMPRPYKKVSSIIECVNEKGTFYQASASADVYCNPHNNHNINDCLLLVSTKMIVVNSSVKSKVFLQNVGFPANAFRHNPTTIDAEIYIDSCKFFRNPNDALSLTGIYKAYLNNSVASYGSKDGFNYHSSSEETTVVEVNCTSYGNGKLKMSGGNTTSHSNNGSTAHDGISILRAGGDYFDCQGPIVADVGDCLSVNFGCSAFDIAEGITGHKSAFLFENVSKKAYVIDCKGGGDNTDYGVKGDVNTTIVGFNGKRIYNGKVNVIAEG